MDDAASVAASKPWTAIPIQECGEPLLAFPPNHFAYVAPHPYQSLGAPYGEGSPYQLRKGVIQRLIAAHQRLQQLHPGFKLQIFDAYRPNAVQQFMVDHSYETLLRGQQGQGISNAELWETVYTYWARPSDNPHTPPPHSTGAAVDLSLLDAQGQPLAMGSPIDELSERSHPDHFARSAQGLAATWHQHRQWLYQLMSEQGFVQHPNEWWHFSYGDQLWAWQCRQRGEHDCHAIYGRADLI